MASEKPAAVTHRQHVTDKKTGEMQSGQKLPSVFHLFVLYVLYLYFMQVPAASAAAFWLQEYPA